MSYTESPSPNHYDRAGYKPELIVVHCTDGFYPGDLQYLQNPAPVGGVGPVSAHYVISPTGNIHHLVDESQGAWHAGRVDKPTAKLLKKTWTLAYVNPNLYTIGIEVSLKPPAVTPAVQYEALKTLVKEIAARWNIPLDRDHVIGHKEIFSQKTCPGTIDVDQLVKDIAPAAPVPTPPVVDKEATKREIKRLVDTL